MEFFLGLLIVVFFALFFVALVVYRALIFSIIWNWFMPQVFGLPMISISGAILLGIVVTYCFTPSVAKDKDWKDLVGSVLLAVVLPLVCLVAAWIAKGFLP